MIFIVCFLTVRFSCGKSLCNADVLLKGKLLSETKTAYLADFSEWATKDGLVGNYSKLTVPKANCNLPGK